MLYFCSNISVYKYVFFRRGTKQRFPTSWDGAEPRLVNATVLLRGIARECVDSIFIEMHGTAASNCVEMRGFLVRGNARICDSQNAWKCAEPRLARECELRVCPRTAARVRGTRVGSAREVRLKYGSSARSRGSAHWLVPYLYGTGTLRVKIFCTPNQKQYSTLWSSFNVSPWALSPKIYGDIQMFSSNGIIGEHTTYILKHHWIHHMLIYPF